MLLGVRIRTRAYDDHVRLRFSPWRQPDWVLDTDKRTPHQSWREPEIEARDSRRVPASRCRHLDNLSINEFEWFVFMQDAGTAHPLVLFDGEPPPFKRCAGHGFTSGAGGYQMWMAS